MLCAKYDRNLVTTFEVIVNKHLAYFFGDAVYKRRACLSVSHA